MSIIDTKNLPAPIVAAIRNDDHISQGSDIGASTVGAPVQQVALRRRHKGEIVEEASDRIWSLFGQAMHVVLERAAYADAPELRHVQIGLMHLLHAATLAVDPELARRAVEAVQSWHAALPAEARSFTTFPEERWEMDVLGWRVAARCDLLVLDDTGTLTDYKVTPVWWTKDDEPKPEWVPQVNVTRYIGFKAAGHNPKRLQVTGLLRDYRPGEKKKYVWYPEVQVATVEIPRWSDDECQAYLEERVRLHQQAREQMAEHDAPALMPCTAEERWERFDCRVGVKTWKSFPTQAEAEAYKAKQTSKSMRIVWEVPRCASYCDVVKFCSQGQRLVAALAATSLK